MKTIYTLLVISMLSHFAKAQSYSGTISPSVPTPGKTLSINFALTIGSGPAVNNLSIYSYNSMTGVTTLLPTTSVFGGTNYLAYYTVPSNTVNNTILDFTVATTTNPIVYYGVVASATVLPVVFKSYTASLLGTDKVSLKWELASTDGISKTIIFRSTDGNTFLPIDTLKSSATQYSYDYTDILSGNSSTYFYKIACISVDGKSIISNTMLVSVNSNSSTIPKILNNAHVTGQLFLTGINLQDYKAGEINVIDMVGRKYQTTILSSNTLNVNNLSTGMYYLKIGSKPPMNFIAQ